ncbi:hypothetical protein AAG570_007033 [Ranatra chinensis]|uniref:RNA-directed DNA polymerase n=1 Tax=Ranatra chinensis TaxID=642074 RepID=A0ABD0YVT3_9HEMI
MWQSKSCEQGMPKVLRKYSAGKTRERIEDTWPSFVPKLPAAHFPTGVGNKLQVVKARMTSDRVCGIFSHKGKNDPSPYLKANILGHTFQGLLDSGATKTIIGQYASDILNRFLPELEPYVFVYLDDIVICSATFGDHVHILERVFRKLKEAGLTLNKEKCQFCRPELKYLGYVVDKTGLKVEAEKLECVKGLMVEGGALWKRVAWKDDNPWRLVVPKEKRAEVMRENHLGNFKTRCRILERCYWPGMRTDIAKYVAK